MSFRIVGISAAVGLAALALSGCVDDYGYYNGYYGGYGPVLYDDYYGPGPYYGGYYYQSGGHRYYHHGDRGRRHGHSGYHHGSYSHGGGHGDYHDGGHRSGGGGHMTVYPAGGGSGTINNMGGFR